MAELGKWRQGLATLKAKMESGEIRP